MASFNGTAIKNFMQLPLPVMIVNGSRSSTTEVSFFRDTAKKRGRYKLVKGTVSGIKGKVHDFKGTVFKRAILQKPRKVG